MRFTSIVFSRVSRSSHPRRQDSLRTAFRAERYRLAVAERGSYGHRGVHRVFYNGTRRHSYLGNKSPAEYERLAEEEMARAA
jgi:hypothetical protein